MSLIENSGRRAPGYGSALPASIAAGITLAIAWCLPSTPAAAILGWVSVFLITWTAFSTGGSYFAAFVTGLISIGTAIRWLYSTIASFGGFNIPEAAAIDGLFDLTSSLQFLLFIFFFRAMPRVFRSLGVRTACAWVAAEYIFPGLFPWQMGHTQLSFLPLVQISDLAGSQLISFVMFWLAEALLVSDTRRRIPALIVFALCLAYGTSRIWQYDKAGGEKIDVAVIQANVSLEEKHDVKLFRTNVERYVELSDSVTRPDALIVWPESVVTEPVPLWIRSTLQSPLLSALPEGRSYLLGTLTYESRTRYFNSAIGINRRGEVLPPYHKRALMPFGEYTPFAETFPWLADINATAGNFTAGRREEVFEYTSNGEKWKISPLICYEDLVPSMARDSVRAGARLLVNITNDAWYGRSAAPYQHHLIASFRAIENRRYLVRSTNTGLTAIVDPVGRTISSLPIFSEGVMEREIRLMDNSTLYTAYISNFPFMALFALICIGIAFDRLVGSRKGRS